MAKRQTCDLKNVLTQDALRLLDNLNDGHEYCLYCEQAAKLLGEVAKCVQPTPLLIGDDNAFPISAVGINVDEIVLAKFSGVVAIAQKLLLLKDEKFTYASLVKDIKEELDACKKCIKKKDAQINAIGQDCDKRIEIATKASKECAKEAEEELIKAEAELASVKQISKSICELLFGYFNIGKNIEEIDLTSEQVTLPDIVEKLATFQRSVLPLRKKILRATSDYSQIINR